MGRKYTAVFWMEMDTLPLKANWLSLLYSHVKHGAARKMGLLYLSSETNLTGISSPLDPLREHPMMVSSRTFFSLKPTLRAFVIAQQAVLSCACACDAPFVPPSAVRPSLLPSRA